MNDVNLKKILTENKTIAVVGISNSPYRASNTVSQYMRRKGYTIFPVNPNYDKIWDLTCYSSLSVLPVIPDIVNIFRRPSAVPAVVDEAIRIGVKVIWMQLGVFDDPAAEKAREAGIIVVMDRCIKIEHARWF